MRTAQILIPKVPPLGWKWLGDLRKQGAQQNNVSVEPPQFYIRGGTLYLGFPLAAALAVITALDG